MRGTETEGGSPSEERSSGGDFASHSVHRHIIHSVDVNDRLADKPLISGSVSFYAQAEISQECSVAINYLMLNICSSFPCRQVASGLITQADCSQSNAWVCSGQGAGVMEVSSMATSELADIVLPCILAEQSEGLVEFLILISHGLQEDHLPLPFSPVLLSRRELQDEMM